MSFDDELRARMKAAAEQAGRSADPTTAVQHLAASSTAGPPRTGPGLKLIAGLGGVSLLTGAVLGATALRGGSSVVEAATIDVSRGGVWDCPNGQIVDNLRAGDRVFVIGTDADGGWSAIRNPRSVNDVVWVPDGSLAADDGVSVSEADLPIIACAVPGIVSAATTTTTGSTSSTSSTSSTTSTSIPSAESSTTSTAPTTTVPGVVPGVSTTQPPAPTTVPTTAAPATTAPPNTAAPTTTTTTTVAPDTQQPTIQASSDRTEIYDASWSADCASSAQLTATAADNVAVTSVRATYAGLPNSPIDLSFSSGAWRGSFGPFAGLDPGFSQWITITLTARDAAGNQASTNVQVRVWGTCLI
jgi:hypothetical protein